MIDSTKFPLRIFPSDKRGNNAGVDRIVVAQDGTTVIVGFHESGWGNCEVLSLRFEVAEHSIVLDSNWATFAKAALDEGKPVVVQNCKGVVGTIEALTSFGVIDFKCKIPDYPEIYLFSESSTMDIVLPTTISNLLTVDRSLQDKIRTSVTKSVVKIEAPGVSDIQGPLLRAVIRTPLDADARFKHYLSAKYRNGISEIDARDVFFSDNSLIRYFESGTEMMKDAVGGWRKDDSSYLKHPPTGIVFFPSTGDLGKDAMLFTRGLVRYLNHSAKLPDDVKQRYIERVLALQIGRHNDPRTTIGSLINASEVIRGLENQFHHLDSILPLTLENL